MEFEFMPEPVADESHENAVKHAFDQLETRLDQELLNDPDFAFTKAPTFTDSSYSVSIGYDYEGRWRKKAAGFLHALAGPLLSLFKETE